MSFGDKVGLVSSQVRSEIHLAITPDDGCPIRLWSQKTSAMRLAGSPFRLLAVLSSWAFFFDVSEWADVIFPRFALCLVASWVGIFVEICFSLTPEGGMGSDTLVAGHCAAIRC